MEVNRGTDEGRIGGEGGEGGYIYKGPDSASFSVSLQATHNRRSEKEERETTIRKYRIPLYSAAQRQVGRQTHTGMHSRQKQTHTSVCVCECVATVLPDCYE